MQKQISLESQDGKLMPPLGNTGAQHTGQRILVDWFAFTLSSFKEVADMFNLLGIPGDEWITLDTRVLGYRTMYVHSELKVYINTERPDMGIHCEFSGSACREFEGFFGDKWAELVQAVRENQGHFTRLDLAIDDFEGLLDLDTIEHKVKEAEIISCFRKGRRLQDFNLSKKDNLGKTLYFGSPQSRIRIRIYDKGIEELLKAQSLREGEAIERESREKVPAADRKANKALREELYCFERLHTVEHWIRTEIQARDERADSIADYLQAGLAVGAVASGVLANYLNFVEPSETDSNKSRWLVSDFWAKFLGAVEKLKLSVEKKQRTLKQVKDWIIKQVAPSLALLSLQKDFKVNLTQICQIALFGMNRLQKRHYQILQASETA